MASTMISHLTSTPQSSRLPQTPTAALTAVVSWRALSCILGRFPRSFGSACEQPLHPATSPSSCARSSMYSHQVSPHPIGSTFMKALLAPLLARCAARRGVGVRYFQDSLYSAL